MLTRLIFVVSILLCVILTLSAQDKNGGTENLKGNGIHESHKFDPSRDAQKDIDNAIVEAKKSDKRILLDVGGEWCIWCHRLDSLFTNNPDLSKYMYDNYVVVKVNYSPENKNENVLSQFPKIPGYPHLFVLNKSGKLLHSQDTGLLESGKGHDKNKVMAFLKKWAPNQKNNNKIEQKKHSIK